MRRNRSAIFSRRGRCKQLLAQAGAQQREAKAREIMASNASPEDKFTALAAISPQHAHQFASGLKEMATMRAVSGLRNLSPEQLQDPDTLERLGASGLPGTAHFTVAAQRLRDQKATADLAGTMRSKAAIQPDPQEVAQAADQGTPTVAAVPAQAGVFATLAQSTNPSIATSAKNLANAVRCTENPQCRASLKVRRISQRTHAPAGHV
jgi:hypothetical protein